MVLAFVVKDDVDLFCAVTTDIRACWDDSKVMNSLILQYTQKKEDKLKSRRTKHDVVLRISVHIGMAEVSREDFDVATSAINLLFVFHSELDH